MQWILCTLLFLLALPAFGQLFKYKDEKGTVHVVDSSDAIPEKYRAQSTSLARAANNASDVDIDLQKEGKSLLVLVSFGNGVEALLVLDTGASISMISPAIAERLTAPGMGGAQVQTASGTVQVTVVKMAEISVAGFTVKDLPMAVHQLPGGGRAQGLLGVDFLDHFRMRLDTQAGRLHLEKK